MWSTLCCEQHEPIDCDTSFFTLNPPEQRHNKTDDAYATAGMFLQHLWHNLFTHLLLKVCVKQKYIFVMTLSHHRNMCHWPLSQIWKITKIAEHIKSGLKIMEKQALLSAVKRWGRVSSSRWSHAQVREGSRLRGLYKDITYSNNES